MRRFPCSTVKEADLMDLYGSRANVLALKRYLERLDCGVTVEAVLPGGLLVPVVLQLRRCGGDVRFYRPVLQLRVGEPLRQIVAVLLLHGRGHRARRPGGHGGLFPLCGAAEGRRPGQTTPHLFIKPTTASG